MRDHDFVLTLPNWNRVLAVGLDTVVRTGFGGMHSAPATDPFKSLDFQNPADLRRLSITAVRDRLARTLTSCREMRSFCPVLEGSYRSRRRWLIMSALTLVAGRLFASYRRASLEHGVKGAGPAIAASALALACRLLRRVLTFVPAAGMRGVDDAVVVVVLSTLGAAANLVQRLDRIGDSIQAGRRTWHRLEVFGGRSRAADLAALSQARQEVVWACPNRVSRLIFLSTLRDNNTGIYRYPALSRSVDPPTLDQMLSDIHRETCEELLSYSFSELVGELDIYAAQTRADRQSFLRTWRTLRAYRSARPAGLDLFTSSYFEVTFDLAVAVLDLRSL